MLATLDPGDEVLMPAPYWTSYSDIVAMAGGKATVIPCAWRTASSCRPPLAAAITPGRAG
jgi:aspartate aminotransferase